MELLKKTENYNGPRGPVVLLIMDGVGIGEYEEGDYVRSANTPNLDWLKENSIASTLKAHGSAVGLPSESDMGNSEVGHNAIGCGRVFKQGAALVNDAIESRRLFDGEVWKDIVSSTISNDGTLHFLGLLSDGNVHSHINHLEALLTEAAVTGLHKARVHVLLDGRDVPPTSCLEYIDRLESFLDATNSVHGVDFCIASGGGRMKITMDRYEADWDMVARGWKIHVAGDGPTYPSAREAIESIRAENPGVLDQDLPPFVIQRDGKPVGSIADGDGVILYNFRGDRAIEISRAFEEEAFDQFERNPNPKINYASMMEYDGDLHIPSKFLVSPPAIDRTLGEYLAKLGVMQFAISETQKYGHVTYFFNGNRSGYIDEQYELYTEIPSDTVPFEERPWMKAAEITDEVVDAIQSNKYGFIRLNYPNGDMVGHTGIFPAVKIAVESVDLCLGRVIDAVREAGGILIVSSDHGNADDMYIRKKKSDEVDVDSDTGVPKAKTAHSLNPVPIFVFDPSDNGLKLDENEGLGIASIAATCLTVLGYRPPDDYTPSVVKVKWSDKDAHS